MMRPIITLTTDFGTQDGYVGAMKGRILSICQEASIIDITHDIQPQNILQASWTLLRSSIHFPANSIHVVVIDPGVGSPRRPVLLKLENKWFIGPDNGVFSELIRRFGTEEIFDIKPETEWWQSHTSFDGLALFAPAAAHLAKGLPTSEFCTPITRLLKILPKSIPSIEAGTIKGKILLFDRFGNALTDISQSSLDKIPETARLVTCKNHDFKRVTHYEQGREISAISLINSDGFLELAVYSGSAQNQFNLKVGDTVTVR